MILDGPAAFAELTTIVAAGDPPKTHRTFSEPAFSRLFDACRDPYATALDRAVLMRHALLYEAARRGYGSIPSFNLPVSAPDTFTDAGLRVVQNRVVADPWRPPWLTINDLSVDEWAAHESNRRFDFRSDPDPFLQTLGFSWYRSRRQRAAARAVLTTPPGCTLAVALATGEGKSLLFELIDKVGFPNNSENGVGVTLVIVPTVALAIDHAGGSDRPRAWYAENTVDNTRIAESICEGSQGLCFASPEAACGPMRSALVTASRLGLLRALVIDEAHMVDAWGTGFRTEFQELSGLHFQLLSEAPEGQEPRTLCLSATLTQMALDTLATLFPGNDFRSLSAAALRPEPDYWFASDSGIADREERVMEALLHVPRPAILYVSEVKDAAYWGALLTRKGFGRLRVMHGQTPKDERNEILSSWRTGSVDVVVATSAFGLGINNQHVRSIVHACVPETLDRYYQEVGRAGRDGKSCLSIVIPTAKDYRIAKALSSAVLISVDRGLERWSAMFNGPKRLLGPNRFALRLDIAPSSGELDIDMLSEKSTDWNARVLTLLARAKLIRLLGSPHLPPTEADDGSWQCVEILDHDHLKKLTWERRVAPLRSKIAEERTRALQLMRQMIASSDTCAASLLRELYTDADPACSRCSKCRSGQPQLYPHASDHEPSVNWPSLTIDDAFRDVLDTGNRLVVFMDDADPLAERHLSRLLPRLSSIGFRNIVLCGEQQAWVLTSIKGLRSTATFVDQIALPGQNPEKNAPEIMIYGSTIRISRGQFGRRIKGRERIVFLPKDASFSDRPNDELRDFYDGRTIKLTELYARMLK